MHFSFLGLSTEEFVTNKIIIKIYITYSGIIIIIA